MVINDATALVTSAHAAHGPALVAELLRRGARKVFVAATETVALRSLLSAGDRRLVPLPLDVTDPYQVAAAARVAGDTTLLINNATFAACAATLHAPDRERARREMDINYFGLMDMTKAFAPVLAGNGGGAIVNMLLSPLSAPPAPGTFLASKAAALTLTRSLRFELAAQHTRVIGVLLSRIPCDGALFGDDTHRIAIDTFDAVERGVNGEFHAERAPSRAATRSRPLSHPED